MRAPYRQLLVALESALFATDAVAHEPLADPTWPEREGRRDFERLLAEAHVDAYAANINAQAFYEHLRFHPRTVSRVLEL